MGCLSFRIIQFIKFFRLSFDGSLAILDFSNFPWCFQLFFRFGFDWVLVVLMFFNSFLKYVFQFSGLALMGFWPLKFLLTLFPGFFRFGSDVVFGRPFIVFFKFLKLCCQVWF